MADWFKRNGIHLAILGIFIVISFVYFSPVIQGKVLPQHDVQQAQGTQKEIMDYKARDGKGPLWTNSMFGGMPAFQIWVQYPKNAASYVTSFLTKTLPSPVYFVLIYLIGAYILFSVLKIKPLLAFAGSVAFAFTSYNFLLIQAGHNNQAMVIGLFGPILAGIILIFRRNRLTGAAVTALALGVGIRFNHIQMLYYLFIVMLIYIGIELYHAIKKKETAEFFKSAGYLAGAALLAVLLNAGLLWTTYEYGKESQRGKSNLKTAAKAGSGLDREYAYAWSQGVGENITFLIPDAYGGASSSQLDEKSAVVKVLTDRGVSAEQAVGFARGVLPTYWGEKSYTAGPFYFGAIVFLLFVLGLFIVRDRIKWWIFSAVVLCLLLSFGRHFPYISDLFFNYFPLYNKFRAVESILAIAGFLFPVLAILAVNEIAFHKPEIKDLKKKLLYSLYITGGLILIVLLVPTLFFSFKSSNHDDLIKGLVQYVGDQSFAESIASALVSDRISMARTDAIRSLIFVLVGAGLVWAMMKDMVRPHIAFILFSVAILTDLWQVDKRYLNKDSFVEAAELKQQYQPRDVDQLIMRDISLDYRVIDLTTNTFNDSRPSFFFKSIGGYHSAKLKRFQEVLDKQFNGALNEDVLDMLNTKYAITNIEPQQPQQGQQPQAPSQKIQNRSTACGNAWIVQSVTYVKDDDQEMAAIGSFDPKKVAFVNEKFKTSLEPAKLGYDPNATITLTDYNPDHLTYDYSAGRDVFAVFSEIWYDKGWNAYVDGVKIPYVRANYILRAAQLPGGNHKLEFKFEPKSYYTGESISLVASVLLILLLLFAVYTEWKKPVTIVSTK